MFIGLRPNTNTGPTNWYKFTQPQITPVTFPTALNNIAPPPLYQLAFNTVNYEKHTTPLLKINLLTKSINIINSNNTDYFQSAHSVFRGIAAEDTGIIPVSFSNNFTPDNIVSFYNISLEREFFISYEASIPGTIYILVKCINWMVIKEDGSVSLAYST